MPESESDLVIFSGNSNKPLVKEICEYLEIAVGRCDVGKFSDGEIQIEIEENVRGRDVFLVQSTSTPVNDHLMELLIMIDRKMSVAATFSSSRAPRLRSTTT
jgi:ribose-phosphate pyrophosphokinase